MDNKKIAEVISSGMTALGMEFGSTRIKSVLVDKCGNVLANGSFSWENRLENKLWTYHLEDAIKGMQESFSTLAEDVKEKYGVVLKKIGSLGISGMMHGIVALDKNNKQVTPFLTWRNTNTSQAASELTELFDFNIPLRWTISQLYQAILEKKDYLNSVSYVSTLAGYIHYVLSGEKNIGIGEASGMFPIDSAKFDFDETMVAKFDSLVKDRKYSWKLRDIFPKVMVAGECAGHLTDEGAALLDPSGNLESGIPMVPPEGDAGTGMTATDSVEEETGNVSAGTSIFSMVVLKKKLSKLYRDIDMVTTPSGKPVAMVHCNNGTSEFDQWFSMFKGLLACLGKDMPSAEMYDAMYKESLKGDPDCSDVIYFNYLSGEPVSGLIDGRPLLVRKAESKFTFANFMRSQLYSVFASLSIGNRILIAEDVKIKRLTGHGGMFKTEGVAQRFLSAAMKAPVSVMTTAGEGGPYGMALLAAFYLWKKEGQTLEAYLDSEIFSNAKINTVMASDEDIKGYEKYMEKYTSLLNAEKEAVQDF